MCSLHFLESSGRTVVTARRRHPADGDQCDEPIGALTWTLIGCPGGGRRDKSSSSDLNCIDWPSAPPPPSHRSPVSQTSRFRVKFCRAPPPALWLDTCDEKGRLLSWKPHTHTHTLCFLNRSAGKQFSVQRVALCPGRFCKWCVAGRANSIGWLRWMTGVSDQSEVV